MELSLTRAPLRRRPNAEPNDGFPPNPAIRGWGRHQRENPDHPPWTLCTMSKRAQRVAAVGETANL
jgi:hypothetical protein